MAIGFKHFLGGFGQALADDQTAKEEWVRDQQLLNRKYAMTTGRATISATKEKRNAALRKASYIQKKGVDWDTIMYIFDEGGTEGLETVYDEIQNTDPLASPESINNLIVNGKNYAGLDNKSFTKKEFVSSLNKGFGLYKSEAANPEDNRSIAERFFRAIAGTDSVDRAMQDTGFTAQGDYSLTDMYRMAATPDPTGSSAIKIDRTAAATIKSPSEFEYIKRSIEDNLAIQEANMKIMINNDESLSARDQKVLNRAIKDAVTTGNYSKLEEKYRNQLLESYIERELNEPGSVLFNPGIRSSIKFYVKEAIKPPESGVATIETIEPPLSDVATRESQVNDIIEGGYIKSEEEILKLPVYPRKDFDALKEKPKGFVWITDGDGDFQFVIPEVEKNEDIPVDEDMFVHTVEIDPDLNYSVDTSQTNKEIKAAARNRRNAIKELVKHNTFTRFAKNDMSKLQTDKADLIVNYLGGTYQGDPRLQGEFYNFTLGRNDKDFNDFMKDPWNVITDSKPGSAFLNTYKNGAYKQYDEYKAD